MPLAVFTPTFTLLGITVKTISQPVWNVSSLNTLAFSWLLLTLSSFPTIIPMALPRSIPSRPTLLYSIKLLPNFSGRNGFFISIPLWMFHSYSFRSDWIETEGQLLTNLMANCAKWRVATGQVVSVDCSFCWLCCTFSVGLNYTCKCSLFPLCHQQAVRNLIELYF